MTASANGDAATERKVVVRDKRKIDTAARGRSGAEPEDERPEMEGGAARQKGKSAGSRATPAAEPKPASVEPAEDVTPPVAEESAAEEPMLEVPAAEESAAEEPMLEVPVAEEQVAEDVEAEPDAEVPVAEDVEAEPPEPGPLGAELEALRAELDERTKDLQRITAEYANYRKRVDRDRGLVIEQAVGGVLAVLLPILDDLDRARDHGDLVGPFGSVAEQLTTALGKFGLTPFGEKDDPFDPTRHEAVAHRTSPDVTESTCVEVMRRGYLLGDRLLRPALVAVADPE